MDQDAVMVEDLSENQKRRLKKMFISALDAGRRG